MSDGHRADHGPQKVISVQVDLVGGQGHSRYINTGQRDWPVFLRCFRLFIYRGQLYWRDCKLEYVGTVSLSPAKKTGLDIGSVTYWSG